MVTHRHFSEIFSTLYKFREEGFLCDTVILTSDKEIKAHSILLAAVSPVFKSAFEDNNKPGQHYINLPGVDSSVVEIALHFIYTGKLLLPHIYTKTNELPKLFAALHHLGLEPQKLSGCEMRFKSPKESSEDGKLTECDADKEFDGMNPCNSECVSDSEKTQMDFVPIIRSPTTEPAELRVFVSLKNEDINEKEAVSLESNEPDTAVEEYDEGHVIASTLKLKKKGRNHSSENKVNSNDSNCTARTRQSKRRKSSLINDGGSVKEDKAKQKSKNSENIQMISLLTGMKYDQVKMEAAGLGTLGSIEEGEYVLQQGIIKEEAAMEANDDDVLSVSNSNKPLYFVLIPAKNSPDGINHLQEIPQELCSRTKKHACFVCSKTCKTRSRLEQHLLIHTGEKPHVCPYCNKGFTNKSNLERHIKMHTGVRPHLCDLCGKGFIQKTSLLDHMIIHYEAKAYKCTICGLSYNRKTNLRQHYKRLHQAKTPQLKDQEEAAGFDAKRPFLCDLCGRGFATVVTLKFHKKLHSGEKPFVCSVCNKGFVQKAQLDQHFRIHTGEKPYVCQTCGKAFVYKDSLTQHNRIHTGEKPYVCQVCSKAYTQSHHLKGHMLTHTGEKPYACQLCSKAYKNRADLRFHSARIHQISLPKLTRSSF